MRQSQTFGSWDARATPTRSPYSARTTSPSSCTQTRTLPAMQQQAVYDLMVARPHEPAGEHFTAAEFHLYRSGYDMALVMALRVMRAAEERYEIVIRTKRIDAAKRRRDRQ